MKVRKKSSLKKRSAQVRVIISLMLFAIAFLVVVNLSLIQEYSARWILIHGLLAGASIVLIMLVVIRRTIKSISTGMDEIQNIAEKVSVSDYSFEAIDSGMKEIDQLIVAMLKMKDDIKDREEELNQVNLELEASLDELAIINNAKTKFFAVFSHEIRNPINSLMGLMELMNKEEMTPHNGELLKTMGESTKMLLNLVNDILDMAKFDENKGSFNDQTTELSLLIENHIISHKKMAQEKALEFEIDLSELRGIHLLVDPTKIMQVVNNLLSNAVKFTTKGYIKLKGEIKEIDNKYELKVHVSDTGRGIKPDEFEKLFIPYQQADESIQGQYGGTGLGLSICQKIAEHYQGTIDVESVYGEGSTFTLNIMLEKSMENLSQIDAPKETYDPIDHVEFILVVEDNEVNRKLMQKFADKYEINCDFAVNGKEAVDKVRANSYDVVLMDCQMPVMDGLEATRNIREFDKTTLVFAMTAFSSKADYDRCRAAGMNGYYTKPVDLKELARLLGKTSLPEKHHGKGIVNREEMKESIIGNLVKETGFDRDTCVELIDTYIDQSESILKEIERMESINDYEGIEKQLHKLKGASGVLHLSTFQELASEAESSFKKGELKSGFSKLQQLRKTLRQQLLKDTMIKASKG